MFSHLYRGIGIFVSQLAIVMTIVCPGFAAPVLDQDHTITSSLADTPSDAQEVGQTFTVGVTGTLSQVSVLLGRFPFASGDARLTIYSTTAGGFPDASLGFVTISAAAVPTSPEYVPVDLTSLNISIAENDVLAFGVKNTGSGPYLMPSASPPPATYGGGHGVRRTLSVPPGPWQLYVPERDFGFRTYVEPAVAMLPGDYNSDGTVDAADYTVWRDNLGGLTSLANDDTAGVGPDDYDRWQTHFGEPSTPGAGASANVAVPEPATIVLILLGAIGGWRIATKSA